MRRGLLIGLILGCGLAAAQDLSARGGFRIKLVEPLAGEALVGATKIRAEVTARDPADVERVDFYLDDKLLFSDAEPPYQVVHDFGKQATAHVIKAVAHHREGIEVSQFIVTRALDFAEVVDVQRVVLNVSVRDREGHPIKDLALGDFSISEDGTAQKLLSMSHEDRPITIGVLLDSSGSMHDRMEEAQTAACHFTDTLRDKDQGFVIDFDELVTLSQPASSDRTQLCRAIKGARAVGGTSLYDAIHAAFRVVRSLSVERSALVVLSDGDDTESHVKLDGLIDEARRNEVSIYAIGLGTGVGSTGRGALKKLAEETGGSAYFVDKASELSATYESIAEDLRLLYQLVYASSNQNQDGKFRRIAVRVTRDGKFDLRHRSGYATIPGN